MSVYVGVPRPTVVAAACSSVRDMTPDELGPVESIEGRQVFRDDPAGPEEGDPEAPRATARGRHRSAVPKIDDSS